MQKTAIMDNLTQNNFSVLLEMMKTLLDQGAISRAEAEKTAQRIAVENKLTLLYLW